MTNTVVSHGNGAQRIIGEVQLIAAPQDVGELSAGIVIILIDRAAHRLGAAQTVGVVGVGDGGAGLGHACQLAAMLPSIGPRTVRQQVANGVVGQRLAVVSRQQILPRRVAVGVGLGGGGGAEGAGSVGVFLLGRNIAAVAVAVRPRLVCRLIILADQLIKGIIGIAGGVSTIGNRGNIPPVIVGVGDEVAVAVGGFLPPGRGITSPGCWFVGNTRERLPYAPNRFNSLVEAIAPIPAYIGKMPKRYSEGGSVMGSRKRISCGTKK